MQWTAEQESLMREGPNDGLRTAMKTLIAYGECFGAERLVPITSSHLAGSFGIVAFSAYAEILAKFEAGGVRVKVPTTTNPRSGHKQNARTRVVFARQHQVERRLAAFGVTPNYSCVYYDSLNRPTFGQVLAWAESSAVQYANSVLGARPNRNSLLIDLCSAVTGFTPEFDGADLFSTIHDGDRISLNGTTGQIRVHR